MEFLEEKTEEHGREMHLPATEKTDEGINVKIGGVLHPMEERHYIEWTEVVVKDGVTRKSLKPNGAPEVAFEIESDIPHVRAYGNIHGLLTEKAV